MEDDAMRIAAKEAGIHFDWSYYSEGVKELGISPTVQLDGDYTVEQLEFIVKWMKENA